MRTLHDPTVLSTIRSRVESLTPQAQPRWGKMTVDQMLWHVNGGLDMATGKGTFGKMKLPPIPIGLMKFMVLNVPWPKGAPTIPEIDAAKVGPRCEFEAERARCLALIDELASRDVTAEWPKHPGFGVFAGPQWSALMAKHLDHHLKQFSV